MGDQQKRLFVSIPLPTALVRGLSSIRNTNADLTGIRWVRDTDVHITVAFIGNVPVDEIGPCIEAVSDVAQYGQPFELRFDGVSFAPLGKPPRMVWAVFAASEQFTRLCTSVHRALEPFLQDKARRKPLPHATLARLKTPDAAERLLLQPLQVPAEAVTVDRIELMESVRNAQGVAYEPVQTFPFDMPPL